MATRSRSGSRKSTRRYGKRASKSVERAMSKRKRGTLTRGKKGHGGKVKSRRQAIAIGLSEAREKGAKVPPAPKGSASARKAKSSRKRSSKSSSRKSASRKSSSRKSASRGRSSRAKSSSRKRSSRSRSSR